MGKYVHLNEDESARLMEYTDRAHPFRAAFGPGWVGIDPSEPGVQWMLILVADWRGVEVDPQYRAAHPLPERAAADHVVPDETSNRGGAS